MILLITPSSWHHHVAIALHNLHQDSNLGIMKKLIADQRPFVTYLIAYDHVLVKDLQAGPVYSMTKANCEHLRVVDVPWLLMSCCVLRARNDWKGWLRLCLAGSCISTFLLPALHNMTPHVSNTPMTLCVLRVRISSPCTIQAADGHADDCSCYCLSTCCVAPSKAPDCCEDDHSQRSIEDHKAGNDEAGPPDHC